MPPEVFAARIVLLSLAVSSPVWCTVSFAAYAIGRRQFNLAMLLTFLGVEAASIAIAIGVYRSTIVAKE
jgi:hypothetical protein